jgi:hypothetical protein
MDDADLISGYGGFVPVEGVRDDLAIFENGVRAGGLTVHTNVAAFEGFFLIYDEMSAGGWGIFCGCERT